VSAEISVKMSDRADGWLANVTVREGVSATTHRVTVKREAYADLTGGEVTPEALVRASFRFLLDREPKESIMRQFDLMVIGMYFPEYAREIRRYCELPG
jgi:hypothetical protein